MDLGDILGILGFGIEDFVPSRLVIGLLDSQYLDHPVGVSNGLPHTTYRFSLGKGPGMFAGVLLLDVSF